MRPRAPSAVRKRKVHLCGGCVCLGGGADGCVHLGVAGGCVCLGAAGGCVHLGVTGGCVCCMPCVL
jgi:hypothetical protein